VTRRDSTDGEDPLGLTWNWPSAALGAVYALPAAGVAFLDVRLGIALAVGVLPAAIVGLPPARRARLAVLVLGVVTAVSMFLGGALAGTPVVAVAAIALLAVASALLAARSRAGEIAMTLSLPLVGIGLSYTDLDVAAAAAGVIVAGSLYASLVAMLWPERTPDPSPPARRAAVTPTLGYGLRLGAAGATAAAIGFWLELEHVGWACAAALMVMRPVPQMQRLRSVGRILAVAVGAVTAIAFVRLSPPAAAYSAAAVASVAAAAATHASRWYVTAAFTTFLVFLLLLFADPETAGSRFGERVGETLLGVGLAYAFGLALPALAQRRERIKA
jgi:hypothetical protein